MCVVAATTAAAITIARLVARGEEGVGVEEEGGGEEARRHGERSGLRLAIDPCMACMSPWDRIS